MTNTKEFFIMSMSAVVALSLVFSAMSMSAYGKQSDAYASLLTKVSQNEAALEIFIHQTNGFIKYAENQISDNNIDLSALKYDVDFLKQSKKVTYNTMPVMSAKPIYTPSVAELKARVEKLKRDHKVNKETLDSLQKDIDELEKKQHTQQST